MVVEQHFPEQHAKIRKLAAEEEMGNANISTQQQSNVATPNPSKGVYDDGKVGVSIIDECGKSGQRVMTWYQQTATAMGGMTAETIADIERQSCMSHDECLGGVKDFSDEFKARWGFKESRCKTIINAIQCSAESIVYGQWRQNMEAHFGCPISGTPSPSNQDQKSQTDQTQQQQPIDSNTAQSISAAISQFTQSV